MSEYDFDNCNKETDFKGFTEPEKECKAEITLEDKEIAFSDDVPIDMDKLYGGGFFKRLNKSSKKFDKKFKKKSKTSKKCKRKHEQKHKDKLKKSKKNYSTKEQCELAEKSDRVEKQREYINSNASFNLSVGNISINIITEPDMARDLLYRCNLVQGLPTQGEILEVNDEQ